MDFIDGDVVLCGSGQAGTIIMVLKDVVHVLLRNGNIWTGSITQCRFPQSQEDLDCAPLEVERIAPKPKKAKRDNYGDF